jgi:hypothetical protein
MLIEYTLPVLGPSYQHMKSSDSLLLAAIAAIIIVMITWYTGRKKTAQSAFCSGPDNLQLYDYPLFYPKYAARAALSWDGDRRCAAYCSKEPCSIWCR